MWIVKSFNTAQHIMSWTVRYIYRISGRYKKLKMLEYLIKFRKQFEVTGMLNDSYVCVRVSSTVYVCTQLSLSLFLYSMCLHLFIINAPHIEASKHQSKRINLNLDKYNLCEKREKSVISILCTINYSVCCFWLLWLCTDNSIK